jgi:hypothetical protein
MQANLKELNDLKKIYPCIIHVLGEIDTEKYSQIICNTPPSPSISHRAHRILLEENQGGTMIWNTIPMRHRTG